MLSKNSESGSPVVPRKNAESIPTTNVPPDDPQERHLIKPAALFEGERTDLEKREEHEHDTAAEAERGEIPDVECDHAKPHFANNNPHYQPDDGTDGRPACCPNQSCADWARDAL